ncbi:hypothetical protein P153DRAFT_287807 [Dothidotthia symphoricarpi CBS 119687]|uniref:Thioesterase domain-containing protein n=1 Tax=Dothidotthia symphoricarpi CBS 119687 TaxID=1392245 RepID=A0A6A6AJ70_9PLEO|nr:uncharacterized protein P153DRAFT_287807 [Dothidotthia symphoricarpi CBS 119687]KAF2131148.1 hypothetical protein P153DRAFT_287807 [Dothidotthia symphoricarpi CBS 119687]
MFRIRHFLHRTPFKPSLPRKSSKHATFELPLESRMRWSYLWYASILALGITTGLAARNFAGPLGLPIPGSREDELILQSLDQDVDKLEIVQSLRKQSFNLAGPRSKKVYGKGWMEVDLAQETAQEGRGSLLETMSGTRGLGVQRAFWNAETREMVAVVWIGGGMSGWPGVAHGGAIATIFEEVMARMVRGPRGSVESIHRPISLSVTYAKPTYSLDFYILRASFSRPNLPQTEPPPEPEAEPTKSWLSWLSPQKDLTKKAVAEQKQCSEIVGTLESVKGDLCVRAKGTFGVNGPTIGEEVA